MKPDPTRTPEFLSHILEAISRIQAYTRGMSSADFNRDVLVQDAVIRNIEIMGEAARNILTFDPSFAAAHPEIPLRDVYLMRNRVAHGTSALMSRLFGMRSARKFPDCGS